MVRWARSVTRWITRSFEGFFATLQTELLDRNTMSEPAELQSVIFEYVETFYNRRRRHSASGRLSPAEFERRWYMEKQVAIA
ncbi:MAG: IS3 family transposase [Bacillota bacterium]